MKGGGGLGISGAKRAEIGKAGKKGGQWDNTEFLRGWEAEGIKTTLAILCNRLKSGDGSR